MSAPPYMRFGDFLTPNRRPYMLGPMEDADLVGMRLYGYGPFFREHKLASKIRKKSHYVIRAGDVIYNKLFAWKGTFGIVPSELDAMLVSDKFPTYELDQDLVDPGYLRWCFRDPQLWEQARQMSTGSAALSKLTLNPPKFLELTAPVPPLPEQRRIVARIDELAAKIDEGQRLREEATEEAAALRASLITHSVGGVQVEGRLESWLRAKPRNGWSCRCDNAGDGIPILRLSAVTGSEYRSTDFKRTSAATDSQAHYWLRKGDLLITRSNTPQLVGHVAIYDGEPSPCIYPDLMMRLDINEERADKRFVWYWLQGSVARQFIMRSAKGTSPSMKKISQKVVMNIPCPANLSLAVQRRTVAQLDSTVIKLKQIAQFHADTAAEIDALLPSILDKAFKGEL